MNGAYATPGEPRSDTPPIRGEIHQIPEGLPPTKTQPDPVADVAADHAIELSVVVPMFDEAAVLPLFSARLRPVLDGLRDQGLITSYEVLAVDDGSQDATPVLLAKERRTWPELRVLRLRANAGHQAALSAGLAKARGAWVASLDADLQDPPETLAEMVATAKEQHVDVVYGVRSDRSSDSTFKRTTARAYYRLMRRTVGAHIASDAGDYRLLSRATVEAVTNLPQTHQVFRLVVPALGFPSAEVSYRRDARAAGTTHYSLGRMIGLSIDSLTGFSVAPLRVATWVGLGGAAATALMLAYAFVAFMMAHTVPGWTSTFVAVAAVGAVQLLCLGILGEYVGRMYTQMQGRPAYYIAHDSLEDD